MTEGYKGLANIGATCYMNSLLQTLFMTREFRNGIYRWQYEKDIDGKQQDSILYQLQKLFAKLETKHPTEVDTRDLVKSFQWGGQEIVQQQDIQEFNRVLFEAIEQSLKLKKTTEHDLLNQLYEGIMLNYTKCRICGYSQPKQETFQDIIITVKNKYAKLYNDSVELGLQRYLKPETLDGGNLYFCDQCQVKVEADRFVRIIKLPKLINLILLRFTFDYMTMSRQKINDEVKFPWVLNMNDYMNGYEGIENKLDENKPFQDFEEEMPAPRKPLVIKRSSFLKSSKKTAKLPNNIKNKPTPTTKTFLSEMRKKTGKNNEPTIEIATKDKYTPITEEEETQRAIEESLKEAEMLEIAQKDTLSVPTDSKEKEILNSTAQSSPSPNKEAVVVTVTNDQPEVVAPTVPVTIVTKNVINQEQIMKFNEQISEKIKQSLKKGDMVYELFSILVHNGGPHHGHYYAYIKSFQDGRWYCFNDYNVTPVGISQMQEKVFGGKGSNNAYGLYYRLIEENKPERVPIPEYILKQLEIERSKIQKIKQQKIQNEDKYIKLKFCYQLLVKQLEILNCITLKECLEKAKALFGQDAFKNIKDENIRLRLFNPLTETKLDTYTGKQNQTLQQLRINSHKCLIIEVKKDQQKFEEYVVGKSNIRLVLWQPNVQSLEQNHLKTIKLTVEKTLPMKEITQRITAAFGLPSDVTVIKRHQNDEYSYHEVVSVFLEKTLEQLSIFQNEILFVEPTSIDLMWPKQFEAEVYRVCIKYNLPVKEDQTPVYGQSMTFDSRMTFGQFRQVVCNKHNLDPTNTIFKRNNRSGMELKCLTDTLKEYRFITGTQIYLEEGMPAQPGQVRIQLFLANPTEGYNHNTFSTFQEVADIPVNGNLKASECKELFVKVLKKVKGIDLDPKKIRIRERLQERMTKIYRQKPMREQQLIEKRAIAIERMEVQENLDAKQNVLYVRAFDPETWILSDRFEVTVSKATTMNELAVMIHEKHLEIPVQNMEICKIMAVYKFNPLDLAEVEYFMMNGVDISVSSEPLFVNNDGLLYIVKDKNKKLRDLTRQQQIQLGGTLKPKTSKSSSYKGPATKKETGVKITVKKHIEIKQSTQEHTTEQEQPAEEIPKQQNSDDKV